jgi:GMP synthase (glutamine-hydrolysing)
MKILLINNESYFFNEIKEKLNKHKLTIENFQNIKKDPKKFDAIILSGGHKLNVENHDKEYEKEIDIIKNSNIPIFGICLGFQLIGHSFMERLEKMDERYEGLLKISRIYRDPITEGVPEDFYVFESHKWHIKSLNFLTPLARSKHGIEILKHPDKMIYGVQFHPEKFKDLSDGYTILNNFLRLIENRVGY